MADMISAIATTDPGLQVNAAKERAEVNREQFLQILVEEMANQNPLDPMDNSQFLEQLVGLQTLEQTSALTDALKTFERFMQMSYSAGLIGREIVAFNLEGDRVEGVVDKVTIQNGEVQIHIGSETVPAHGILEIR